MLIIKKKTKQIKYEFLRGFTGFSKLHKLGNKGFPSKTAQRKQLYPAKSKKSNIHEKFRQQTHKRNNIQHFA